MSNLESSPTGGPQVIRDEERELEGEKHTKAESRVYCN
jgi:hypothetical protein